MEISRENKLSKWKQIIKKLHNSKIADQERLNTIENQLSEGTTLYNNDIKYLNEKFNQLQNFQNTTNETSETQQKPNFEQELQLIDQLHQKEIGDFSRLESIRNYLTAGQPLLYEDGVYLKEHHEQLKKVLGLDQFNYDKTSKTRITPLEPQAILIDDVEKRPTHEFSSLSKTISNIIRSSTPHFTIGIYGEWGTGKTTLMSSIEKNLVGEAGYQTGQKILPIWFNAWKYEREENLATVSLLKTVGYAMANHEKYDGLSKTIFKGLTTVSKDLMQQIAMQIVSDKHDGDDKEFDDKMNYLNKLYRESVYYEGLDKIKEQMKLIREEDSDYRVVIFIDDLDRCSPVKALEVLESIKLFLDVEGFVFVIGLSHKTVTQLITHAYKLTGVKGEDYIKKIIQIPIKIPSWSKESIIDLINNSIIPRLNSDYARFLHQNSGMVARVVDYNPRQLKRFINNVIIAFETFASNQGSPDIHFNEIFLVKILKSEWPDFYQEFAGNKDFRDIVRWMLVKPRDLRKYFKYLKTPTDEFPIEQKNKRIQLLSKLTERTNGKIGSDLIAILSDFDYDTWIFFDNVKEVLYGIQDWKVTNSVMDVVEEFSYDLPIGSNKSKAKQEAPKPVQQLEQEN
jgi:DNA replication protein DnaC